MLLNDAEQFALEILANIRMGILQGYDCNTCPAVLQDDYNCDLSKGPDHDMYSPEMDVDLNTCPLNFLRYCNSVMEFIDDYDIYEKYPTSIKFDPSTINARYWDAVKYYEGQVNDIKRRQQEQSKNKK